MLLLKKKLIKFYVYKTVKLRFYILKLLFGLEFIIYAKHVEYNLKTFYMKIT